MFPEKFTFNYSYDSFEVLDFDSVDNGVEDHVFDILNKNDYSLVISKWRIDDKEVCEYYEMYLIYIWIKWIMQ